MTGAPGTRSAGAGIVYALLVFLAGFILGVVRVLGLVPIVGEVVAVAMELPVILAFAWLACRWVTRRLGVPQTIRARLVMGAAALFVILGADVLVGLLLAGQPPASIAARYATAAGIAGLAGQLLFAAFPILQIRSQRRAAAR
jgi:hypothetical protein